MDKNNEITDDDTAHKIAALKKDGFFCIVLQCTSQSVGIKTGYFD